MTTYHKIYSPFKRGPDNKFTNEWYRPEFGELSVNFWDWSEKIDGMNLRVLYDGHNRTFAGRTDNASFNPKWLDFLEEKFPIELLEQTFGEQDTVIYGELFGEGIQKGGPKYGPLSVTMFDVKIGEWWLEPDNVRGIAASMKIHTPAHFEKDVFTAIEMVEAGLVSEFVGSEYAEGLVGRAPLGIRARNGDRLIMKVKTRDFRVP